jgi:hypothetical protein
MIEFNVAAKESEAQDDEDVVEVPIDGVTYYARRPTVAQGALLNLTLSTKGRDRLSAVFDLIFSLMGGEALEHIRRLVMERRIDYGDLIGYSEQNPDGGLVDLIFKEFAERPTQPSDDSSLSQAVAGRRSAGRSPGKGSTRSSSTPSTSS